MALVRLALADDARGRERGPPERHSVSAVRTVNSAKEWHRRTCTLKITPKSLTLSPKRSVEYSSIWG